MKGYSEDVQAYIDKAAPFAKPILVHLRLLVHAACPEVEEAMKWSFPNFQYKGSIMCNMAAFKHHCSFGFWLGALLSDPANIINPSGEKNAMGNLGQIKSLADLPPDEIMNNYLKEAMKLIEAGAKMPKSKKVFEQLATPPVFQAALEQHAAAKQFFEALSPSQKKEYLFWIDEAKTDATKLKRTTTAIEWLSQGKNRNWKYE